ncbi:MAG: S8 family peptidase [Pseudomonadota bacterium]
MKDKVAQTKNKLALLTTRVVGLLFICAASVLSEARADAVEVAADRYLITRKTGVSSTKPPTDPSYVISQTSGYFDLVIPKSAAQSIANAGIDREPLNWAKVNKDCAEILQDESVASCEPDVLLPIAAVPNDPMFGEQWGLSSNSSPLADIDAPQAWDRGVGSKSVLLGVIDTGIYSSHPDLAPNLWSNPLEAIDGVDNDVNVYIDDILGANTDAINNDINDCQGHGTHVSGIIGAKGNNGIGVTGVNWNTTLVTAKANQGCEPWFSTSGLVRAYNYFYDLKLRGINIRAVNASIGGTVYSEATYEAIVRLNSVDVLLVAAAGNSSKDMDVTPHYPASYAVPNVISVAATGSAGQLAPYSNFGWNVTIAAPGGDNSTSDAGDIMSTKSPITGSRAFYGGFSGTSMAAPMVAGAIGLVASQAPHLSGSELKDIASASARQRSNLIGKVVGGRFLNVKAMSDMALGVVDNCPSDPEKTEPGICGCGVADVDSDGDTVLDCQESCPSDPSKLSAGVCGCGVADSDSDGDSVVDCQDACPSDRGKTTPGVCGCGIADSDANGNGVIDCQDRGLSQVIPVKPRIQAFRDRMVISMQPGSDVRQYVQISLIPPLSSRRRPVTRYFITDSYAISIFKPARGSIIMTRYAYLRKGTTSDFSYWSSFAMAKVKR